MTVTLERTLQATGFMIGDAPAPGLRLQPNAFDRVDVQPDAVWRDRSRLEVVFKYVEEEPEAETIASWHRDVWNLGLAPLLWVVSPECIRLYNAYERPSEDAGGRGHLLREVRALEGELASLDDYAGRLAMTSGRFWANEPRVRREGRVDVSLLEDLRALEWELREAGLPREVAQGIAGRSIFIRYLLDRGIVSEETLPEFGDLRTALGRVDSAYRLFSWVRTTFNGDLFPVVRGEQRIVQDEHLKLVSETLAGVGPTTGQSSLWEYRFEAIPIELISSIYEQFAHSAEDKGNEAESDRSSKDKKSEKDSVHYTPMSVVNLVLDEVMRGIHQDARVLDLTCGSAVFLVEAMRRLVALRAGKETPSRSLIRETLKNQVFGVDKSASAIRVASFSLYLLALELDPDPTPPEALRFEPLIGRNLFVGNAFDFDRNGSGSQLEGQKFDVVVGNPPWTYGGKAGKLAWPKGREKPQLPPRSQDFAFVWRSMDFADADTRFGMVMRATPFFSSYKPTVRARAALLDALKPVGIVDLSALRAGLFPTADHPAVVVFGRVSDARKTDRVPVVSVPWSWTFERTGAIEMAPSDVRVTRLSEVARSPQEMKATARGTTRDRVLRQRVEASFASLRALLEEIGVEVITGVQTLTGDGKDSRNLLELPMLTSRLLTPRIDTGALVKFTKPKIHRPRDRAAFRAPLLVVSEGVRVGIARPAVGVSEKDLVYTRSYYGMSFFGRPQRLVYPLAGVLMSSMMAWHILLTGSEFGIHTRKALRQDIVSFPTPPMDALLSSDALPIASAVDDLMRTNRYDDVALSQLDEAVFDVYGLDDHERLVVLDGVARGRREFKKPRMEAEQPVSGAQLDSYAAVFLSVINAWQAALGRNVYVAEIVGLRNSAALRVIRFAKGGSGGVQRKEADRDVREVLERIGRRIRVPITENLAAARELRVHGFDGEVLVVKPASRRYWTQSAALNDADSALGDGLVADVE